MEQEQRTLCNVCYSIFGDIVMLVVLMYFLIVDTTKCEEALTIYIWGKVSIHLFSLLSEIRILFLYCGNGELKKIKYAWVASLFNLVIFIYVQVYLWNTTCKSTIYYLSLVLVCLEYAGLVLLCILCCSVVCIVHLSSSTQPTILRSVLNLTQVGTLISGLMPEEIAKISTRPATKEDTSNNCAVCLETFQVGQTMRVPNCEHLFHQSCVDEWFARNKTCPLCRTDCTPNV